MLLNVTEVKGLDNSLFLAPNDRHQQGKRNETKEPEAQGREMSLDKLRKLHEAATKPPWVVITGKTIAGITSNDCQIYMLKDPGDMKFSVPTWKANAEIGAYLRNHAEAIIALIDAADAVDSDWNRTSAMQLRAAVKSFEDES